MYPFDSADCFARYNALVRERPDQFANPDGAIYEILLESSQIDRARHDAAAYRRAHGLPDEDTRVGVLAVDPYLIVMRDAVRFADGTYGLYNRLLVPSGAAILPMLGERIVLLHRFRHGTRRWHLEAPRGSFSGVGTQMEEAERELVEEIGARPIALEDLGDLHSTTGCLDELHRLYLARIEAVGAADRHEAIESIQVLPVATIEQMIAAGTITDGPTLALFLRARLRGYL
jgi:ADP-ribose pyrophosphatase